MGSSNLVLGVVLAGGALAALWAMSRQEGDGAVPLAGPAASPGAAGDAGGGGWYAFNPATGGVVPLGGGGMPEREGTPLAPEYRQPDVPNHPEPVLPQGGPSPSPAAPSLTAAAADGAAWATGAAAVTGAAALARGAYQKWKATPVARAAASSMPTAVPKPPAPPAPKPAPAVKAPSSAGKLLAKGAGILAIATTYKQVDREAISRKAMDSLPKQAGKRSGGVVTRVPAAARQSSGWMVGS